MGYFVLSPREMEERNRRARREEAGAKYVEKGDEKVMESPEPEEILTRPIPSALNKAGHRMQCHFGHPNIIAIRYM